MSIPRLIGTVDPVQSGAPDARLIVLGPSLGTTTDLWEQLVPRLAATHRVLRFDLPGHGMTPPACEPFTVAELAEGVLRLVDSIGGGAFDYAGISLGGTIGLELALRHPGRLTSLTLASTGSKIGTAESWADRAAQVRASGTASVVSSSATRWYADGFIERVPARAAGSFERLLEVDDESYALCCEALAAFDVTSELERIAVPTLCIGGEYDLPTPAAGVEALASAIPDASFVLLGGSAHPPAYERPAELATLLEQHLGATGSGAAGISAASADASGSGAASGLSASRAATYDAGMAVRREVLGGTHVDRANAAITPDTADFQNFITRYAWGEVWSRPGLDRRSRSLLTLASLITGGHENELAMHLRAALTNGLSRAEITEAVLHTALYAGLPAANSAFAVLRETFAALDAAAAEGTSAREPAGDDPASSSSPDPVTTP